MKRMFLAAVLAAFASAPAGAATLYVGHGIPGKAFGDDTNKLPVDICVVGGPAALGVAYPAELFSGVEFGQFAQVPLDLPAGRYDVEVQLPGGGTCDGDVAVAGSVFLGIGENATAFAHLTEQGTAAITKYVNDVRPLASGHARLYARHAAAVDDVDVYVKGPGRPAFIRGLENPDQEGADLRAGSTFVAISREAGWRGWGATSSHGSSRLFSARLDLSAGTAYFAYAVGSPEGGTFTVLLQPLTIQ
jgi:hypothetical protein